MAEPFIQHYLLFWEREFFAFSFYNGKQPLSLAKTPHQRSILKNGVEMPTGRKREREWMLGKTTTKTMAKILMSQ